MPSQSGDETATTMTRNGKFSAYQDVNYVVVLETKNSFMRASLSGIVDEDRRMCDKLLREDQPVPQDSMFDGDRLEEFCSHLKDRSEARIYLDLHPLLVPSAENLFLRGQRNLQHLIDGYNDLWVKTIPFYKSRPQPDHAVGVRWSAFTEIQRRKLGIEPSSISYYTAREDVFFPFLTSEVKCGKASLELADRANANSMTIALRGVVELFRKARRSVETHRRILAFSISHDDSTIRLYAHYPEIDGDKTSYYRYKIKQFDCSDGGGVEKWTCYKFTRNIYEKFFPAYLKMIKGAIDQLPDPVEKSSQSVIAADEESALTSPIITPSAPEPQGGGFKKPGKARGVTVELRATIQSLQRQLEQQREEANQRNQTLAAQLEQQRKDSEQQRKDSEQRRKDSEHRANELMQLMKQQSEQMKQQSEQLGQLLKNR